MILEAARHAPSGANAQPWHFIVVSDQDMKNRIADYFVAEQRFRAKAKMKFPTPDYRGIASAPGVIVVAGDFRWVRAFPGFHDDDGELARMYRENAERILLQSVAAATMSAHLAAAALGYKVWWITAIGQDKAQAELKPLLDVPDELAVLDIMCFGHPLKPPYTRWKKELDEIVHHDRFDRNRFMTIEQIDETSFTVEKMEIDADGRPQPTGEFETIEADTLILALGQDVDTAFLERVPGVEMGRDGVVQVTDGMMTGREGLFAGGDMVPAERTVTVAVGHGKKAARNIDAWLRGETYERPEKHELATFENLNTWYYDDAPQVVQDRLDIVRRQSGFQEVLQGLTEDNALFEARRCLSCGNCFECDNCYGICPDNAVIKLGPGNRFQFNYDYCKGCGMCAEECPCGAIKMVPEVV